MRNYYLLMSVEFRLILARKFRKRAHSVPLCYHMMVQIAEVNTMLYHFAHIEIWIPARWYHIMICSNNMAVMEMLDWQDTSNSLWRKLPLSYIPLLYSRIETTALIGLERVTCRAISEHIAPKKWDWPEKVILTGQYHFKKFWYLIK